MRRLLGKASAAYRPQALVGDERAARPCLVRIAVLIPIDRPGHILRFRIGGLTVLRLLARAGFLERDDVDGEFGPKTTQAVRRFQRENDLRVTGEVDERTWDKLRMI